MRYQIAAFADEADAAISGQIEAMRAEHISLLEIRGVDGKSVADLTVPEAKALRARLADEGIAVWSVGSPYGKSEVTEAFGLRLDEFRHGLELAAHPISACSAFICRAAKRRKPSAMRCWIVFPAFARRQREAGLSCATRMKRESTAM